MKVLSDQYIESSKDSPKDCLIYMLLSALKAKRRVLYLQTMIREQEFKYPLKTTFNLTQREWTQLEFVANLKTEMENEKALVKYVEQEYCTHPGEPGQTNGIPGPTSKWR